MDKEVMELDLYAADDGLTVEELPEGNALGCFSSASCAACASCPLSSAGTFTSASSFSC